MANNSRKPPRIRERAIRHFRRLLSLSAVLTAAAILLLAARATSLYSGNLSSPWGLDEEYWLQRTYFYYLLFEKKDFTNPDWFTPAAYDVPNVGAYIFGGAMKLVNGKVVDTKVGLVGWFRTTNDLYCRKPMLSLVQRQNTAENRRLLEVCNTIVHQQASGKITSISQEDYAVGKRVSLFFGFGATLLMIALCARMLGSLLAGLVGAVVFLSSSVTLPVFQQVYVDSMCSFFVFLSVLTLMRLSKETEFRAGRNGRATATIAFYCALEGVFLALAVGIKFINIYAAVLAALVLLLSMALDLFWSRREGVLSLSRLLSTHAARLATTTGFALTVFLLLHPTLYPDPIGNISKMMEYRANYMKIQSIAQSPSVQSAQQRLELIYRKGVLANIRLNGLEAFAYSIIFLAGVWTALKRSLREVGGRWVGPYTILLLWASTTFTVNGLGINMDWNRYYVPFLMCTCVFLGLGAKAVLKSLEKSG